MPLPTAISRLRRPVSRRTVLVFSAVAGPGVAGAALTGCSAPSNRAPGATPRPTAHAGPDPQLADLRAEAELLSRYDATIAAHPALASRLRPVRTDHSVHYAALHRLLSDPAGPEVTRPAVPADQAAALRALRSAEQDAAAARTDSCVAAAGKRCGLLGSIAASEASHVELLS